MDTSQPEEQELDLQCFAKLLSACLDSSGNQGRATVGTG
jgi:hypothetical protein